MSCGEPFTPRIGTQFCSACRQHHVEEPAVTVTGRSGRSITSREEARPVESGSERLGTSRAVAESRPSPTVEAVEGTEPAVAVATSETHEAESARWATHPSAFLRHAQSTAAAEQSPLLYASSYGLSCLSAGILRSLVLSFPSQRRIKIDVPWQAGTTSAC